MPDALSRGTIPACGLIHLLTVAPRCNESQEFRFFGELSFVTARFWKKFLIARSVCVGAGV